MIPKHAIFIRNILGPLFCWFVFLFGLFRILVTSQNTPLDNAT